MSEAREQYRELVRQIKDRLPIQDVIAADVKLVKKGREFLGLCPFHAERTPSFTVVPGDKGFYHCFGCGAHGDLIAFVMARHSLDFVTAISDLAADAGLEGPQPPRRERRPVTAQPKSDAQQRRHETEEEERERRIFETARRLWREAEPANGTIVEAYLAGARRIDLEAIGGVPPTLRYHPELNTGKDNGDAIVPGMVAPIQDVAGALIGIHRTFLKPDGAGKAWIDLPLAANGTPRVFDAKRTLGGVWGGAIRLCALDGHRLGIGEGIETCLTVLGSLLRTGRPMPIWCAVNRGNMAGAGDPVAQQRAPFHPTKVRTDPATGEISRIRLPTDRPDMERPGLILPRQVKHLFHLCDADSDPYITRALMERATRRRQTEGVQVTNVWPPRGYDFNDLALRYRAPPAEQFHVPSPPPIACMPEAE